MKLYVFLLLFFVLFGFKSISQINKLNKIQSSDLSISDKILKIDSLLTTLHNDSLFYLKAYYARWLYKNDEKRKAIIISKDALELIRKSSDTNYIQKTLFWTGYYLKDINTVESSSYYLKCLSLNSNNKIAINAYYFLGNNYCKNKDYIKSTDYYKATIHLSKENKIKSLLKSSYFNIAKNYYALKGKVNLLNSLKYAKITDSLFEIHSTSKNNIYLSKLLLASIYNEEVTLDIPKSLNYYKQAIEIAKIMNDSSKINNIILEIGNLYNTTNAKKSLYYLSKVKPKPMDSTLISDLAFNYALTYDFANKHTKSIEQFKKAIKYRIGENFSNLSNNDSILFNTKYKGRLLHILPFHALSLYNTYKETKNDEYLVQSLFYYKLADKLIDLVSINSSEFKSRLFWREKSEQIYSKAIEVAFLSKNIAEVFYFMEKNKALLLMEDVAKEQYKATLNVAKNLLAKEVNLKKDIILLKKTKNTKKIIDAERKLSMLQDSIYGKKNNFNIKQSIVSLQQLQKQLTKNEVFVEYFFSNNKKQNNGYVVFLTNKSKYLCKVNNLAEVKLNLKNLINTYKKPLKTTASINAHNKLSFKVYNKLFPTDKIKELLKNKKVTIATDGYLSYLPFEAFITQKDSTRYLIEDCTISYEYSYSFSQNKKPLVEKRKINLGVAPFVFKDSSLTMLDNSPKELTALSKFYPSILFERDKAIKDKFINEMANYNIIHLATHANAQDSITPWIAFYDKKLNLPELQLLQNNASLVVLSGCNTTLGKQELGEGVMSLARGFFYGGAQSVISSLWSIDDVSTTFIMEEFYKNLSKGKTKSESLSNAKLAYLEAHSLSEVSPHFWASFILLGSDDTIIPPSNTSYYVFLFILLLLIIIVLRCKLKK